MTHLNCLGDLCPVPTLKVKSQLALLASGESLTVIVDHSCSVNNITEICRHLVARLEVSEVAAGIWIITLTA